MSAESLRKKLAKKQKEIKESTGQRSDVIKPAPGKNKYRILPAHPDTHEDDFYVDFGLHYIKSAEKDETSGRNKAASVYVCTQHTFGKPCAVCQAIETAAHHAMDDEQLQLIEDSKCKKSTQLVNVLHLNGDKPTVPQIMQLTPTTFDQVISIWQNYDEEGMNILDYQDGVDIIIERQGTGIKTTYDVSAAARSNPVDPETLEPMDNLKDFVDQESDEGLQKALNAVGAIVGIVPDMKPKALESKAPEKALEKAPAKSPSKVTPISDDDMADIMEAVGDIEAEEMQMTGTDDVPVKSAKSDDDDEDWLKELKDL